MALVKCSECNNLVSNKTFFCPNCGYHPRGNCMSCKHYINEYHFSVGKCEAAEKESARKDKSVCPAVVWKNL